MIAASQATGEVEILVKKSSAEITNHAVGFFGRAR